jgi:hypothetical protein
MPEGWPEHLLAWVQEQQSHWPLNAAHVQQLLAGDDDCENIDRSQSRLWEMDFPDIFPN